MLNFASGPTLGLAYDALLLFLTCMYLHIIAGKFTFSSLLFLLRAGQESW